MKILIIVGHGKSESGGYDPGAVNGGLEEFQLSKEIAKAACEHLRGMYGADCGLMNYEKDLYLQDRIDRLQDRTYDFIAEVHLNSFHDPAANGTEAYFFPGDETGQQYAECVTTALCKALGTVNRGAKAESKKYGIISRTVPTAILIETCFISNPGEVAKVTTTAGQQLAGEAIAVGIAKAAGLSAVNWGEVQKPDAAPAGEFITSAGHWVKSGNDWKFVTDDGSPTGGKWLVQGNSRYFFAPDGVALKGSHRVGGADYYFMREAEAPFKECEGVRR